ncbi:MAG: glycoside hydrolase family 65 protein [Candidatus Omnitrophica bacterium]|nr:glycoside hydrolase family 65 protein [Candidatus Omnitrophota bacterium]
MGVWKLTYKNFNPDEESLRETLCTLGNGYFGTRGAVCESEATKIHYPGTYVAGVYNTLATEIAGKPIYNEDFVNCPNWLMMNFRIDDDPWYSRSSMKILNWFVELNMHKGTLSRRVRIQDSKGRITRIEEHRVVSMANPHCAGQRYSVTCENYSGKITFRSGIDGAIINAGVERYKQLNSKHLEPVKSGAFSKDGIYLTKRTSQSKIDITEALRTVVYKGHNKQKVKLDVIDQGKSKILHQGSVRAKKGEKITVEKFVSVYTSRDHGVDDHALLAKETVDKIDTFETLYKAHAAKWKALWNKFDIDIKGDKFVQLSLRLHIFHLLQSASTYNEDIDAGMTARGLHGEAYRGHVFWDELYIYPLYNLHAPEITRALLMYRYRRLGAAKEYAKQNGYKGAMYPWQSASLGDETSQVLHLNPMSGKWDPDFSCLQRHVSIAVAYNVWEYYRVTGDRGFLNRFGAEMILEISHFWSSICQFNKKQRRFEIEGVMGPDEYHEKYPKEKKGGLKNNAYTNVMVVWVLEKALHILDQMLGEEERQALLFKTEIDEREIKRWREIIHKMKICVDKDGYIHQFEGYMKLKELDWNAYRKKYDNIRRMDRILKAEGSSPDEYQLAKQADTLMLFFVLSPKELKEIFTRLKYPFSKETMKRNFKYYFARTSHGSTLSYVVHGYVAELLGFKDKSMGYLLECLRSDIYDTQGGTTQEGIHCGVMGSSIDLFLKCFAGLSTKDDHIELNPNLPKGWTHIKFKILFRKVWIYVTVLKRRLKVTTKVEEKSVFQVPKEIPLYIKNKKHNLTLGKTQTIVL